MEGWNVASSGWGDIWRKFGAMSDNAKRWGLPFPMGVFGTLRYGWTNNGLMGNRAGVPGNSRANYSYQSHYKAFLPHFVPVDLSLQFCEGAAGVFEIFTYTPSEWNNMIVRVDRLEGFDPHDPSHTYYHRTLVWMRILPSDFDDDHFDVEGSRKHYRSKRDLQIPKSKWEKYPTIACWVYSSIIENQKASAYARKSGADCPVLWDGKIFTCPAASSYII